MAKVTSPLMSQEAHGALGGIEFRQNRYGAVVGDWSKSAHRYTEKQLRTRSRLKLAHAAYTLLSQPLQAAWDAKATPPLTGRNLFVSRWLRMRQRYSTPSLNPAATATTRRSLTPTVFDFDPAARTFTVTFPFEWPPPTSQLFSYFCAAWSPRPPRHPRQFRWLLAESSALPSYITLPFWPPWIWLRFDEVIPGSGQVVNSAITHLELP